MTACPLILSNGRKNKFGIVSGKESNMASITPRKNKHGEITSYQIEVYRGRDQDGKKLKPYSMTWSPPEGWKSEAKIQKELEKVAGQFEADCKIGKIALEKLTFMEYSARYMKLIERDKKHKTAFRYNQLLERINEELGEMKLDNITGVHLDEFYLKLAQPGQNKARNKQDQGLSAQTILHHHRLIHAIFEQALKNKLVSFNPANDCTPPKAPKHEAEFFEIEEILKIREALWKQPLKWVAATCLLIDTGGRRGEVIGMRWESVSFTDNTITIENNLLYTPDRGIYADTPKNGKEHTISITPEVMNILRMYRKEQMEQRTILGDSWKDTGYCFTQADGSPMHPDSINNWLKKFAEENGLPHIHPHKFRHSQASILYACGVDPVTISKRLGHSQVSTTQNIYSHLLKESDRSAADKLAEIYRKQA